MEDVDKVLIRTTSLLIECAQHLKSTDAYGTAIESYLTQHALVIFCAEIQSRIYEILDERANLVGDEGIRAFVAASGKKIFRSVQKDSIANVAELFGKNAKDKFNSGLDDRDVTLYNNAVRDRHDVAHSSGVNVSFGEVRDAVNAAKRILATFQSAIQPVSAEKDGEV